MVVPAFPKLSETFIVSKFLGLLGRGFDVRVLCGRSDPVEWARFPELAARPELHRRVLKAWPVRPRWLAAPLWPAALAWCAWHNPRGLTLAFTRGRGRFGFGVLGRLYLEATLIAARPDLVHFEFGTLALGRTWIGAALGCKVIVSFRGFDLNLSGLDQDGYYREVWEGADALHFLGTDLRRCAIRRGCPADVPHVLIPPAIDIEFFKPDDAAARPEVAEIAGRPLRILGVGRLDWRKGYDDALMAVRRLIDQGIACEYRIVGGGDHQEAVAFARHQLGLVDRVHLMGPLPRTGVREQARWSDVLLHAAVSEGFCNAVVEAQAMGRPVVCTDAGGLPENVADGVTGFVVPRRDPDAMADRLAALAADPALRMRMGAAGRQRVLDCFDLTRQLDTFAKFYEQVLADTPRQGLGAARSGIDEPYAGSRA
jgi:colanic acid/amylovoran biosynthesis glycosyltransferase